MVQDRLPAFRNGDALISVAQFEIGEVDVLSQPRQSLKEYMKSKQDNEMTRLVQEYEKNQQRLDQAKNNTTLLIKEA